MYEESGEKKKEKRDEKKENEIKRKRARVKVFLNLYILNCVVDVVVVVNLFCSAAKHYADVVNCNYYYYHVSTGAREIYDNLELRRKRSLKIHLTK